MSNFAAVYDDIKKEWDSSIIPCLSDYIKVPSQSPHYDPEWATNGLQEEAMAVLMKWLDAQPVKGMKRELFEEPGRTPFLLIEIDGTTPTEKTLFMYGHMDKQPPLLPWDDGLGPYTPVIRDDKLYGRAGADDGYAICGSVASVLALQRAGIPHGRIVITIEGCEESGSFDLPHYINLLKDRIGDVDLVICLDAGALNYDQLWLTTSLRGVTGGVLTVKVLTEGMHSGIVGGVVPDSFRIARHLLDRIEDSATGEFKVKEAYCEVPKQVVNLMEALNDLPDFKGQFATLPGMSTEPGNNLQLGLNNFWRPCLTVTGDNLPAVSKAGNVIRTETQLKLSVRLPPTVDASTVNQRLTEVLEANPPYNCKVTFEPESAASGWAAPALKPWLKESLEQGSIDAFGKPFAATGLGGSIPFMNMLGEMYPEAQFVVTGVLGPKSNAHGPNEFLHIPFGKGITCCMARVVADHYTHATKQ